MATLTEKQEAVKEVLGSTDAIRNFVRDNEIHLEELRGYISRLESVVKSLEETKKREAIETAKTRLEQLRSELALSGLSGEEIASLLGLGNSATKEPSKSERKGAPKAKYIFPLGNNRYSEPTVTTGVKKEDSELMIACKAAGYEKLSDWVKADNFQTIQKAE